MTEGFPHAPLISAVDLAHELGQAFAPTEEQRAVIEAPLGPCLVVAGAGAGKTETMAGRVVWLIANRYVTPDQVLGLTFTRKAAQQLMIRVRKRLARLAGAALRVVPSSAANDGTRGSRSRHSTSLSAGRRVRVTPCATMFASVRIGAPAARADGWWPPASVRRSLREQRTERATNAGRMPWRGRLPG